MASNNDIYHQLAVSELSALLCATGDTKIPDRFIVNEAFRPSIPHQGLLPSSQLPIIDLGGALAPRSPDPERSGRRAVATALTDACKEWGFCQVVNHGVPPELLEKMATLGHDFISLPTEQKERAISSFLDGYDGRSKMVKGVGSFWLEGFTLRVAPKTSVEDFANKVWPEGNPTFCETVYEFTKEVGLLRNAIFKLLAEELGLETNFFSRHFEEGGKFGKDVRVNYYPACSQPSMALGTAPHTDPTVMTILYQDSGEGLQVLTKDGSSWHLVEYKRGALIILVNDVLPV